MSFLLLGYSLAFTLDGPSANKSVSVSKSVVAPRPDTSEILRSSSTLRIYDNERTRKIVVCTFQIVFGKIVKFTLQNPGGRNLGISWAQEDIFLAHRTPRMPSVSSLLTHYLEKSGQ